MSNSINCLIKGEQKNVDKAKSMIIENFYVVETLEIPNHLCGRVIGKYGIHFKSITKATGTRLAIDTEAPAEVATKKCSIKGTRKGVKKAKDMVQERLQDLEDEEDMRDDSDYTTSDDDDLGRLTSVRMMMESLLLNM